MAQVCSHLAKQCSHGPSFNPHWDEIKSLSLERYFSSSVPWFLIIYIQGFSLCSATFFLSIAPLIIAIKSGDWAGLILRWVVSILTSIVGKSLIISLPRQMEIFVYYSLMTGILQKTNEFYFRVKASQKVGRRIDINKLNPFTLLPNNGVVLKLHRGVDCLLQWGFSTLKRNIPFSIVSSHKFIFFHLLWLISSFLCTKMRISFWRRLQNLL